MEEDLTPGPAAGHEMADAEEDNGDATEVETTEEAVVADAGEEKPKRGRRTR